MTLIVKLVIFGLLLFLSQMYKASAAESQPVASATFERTVYFFGSDGGRVAVEPGTYQVERKGSTLVLTPGPLTIEGASLSPDDVALPEPTVMSVTRNGDDHLLLYTASDGAVAATGTYSGIQSRETRLLSPSLAMQIVPVQTQLPGGNILPGVPLIKSVSYASFAYQGALVPFANATVSIVMHNFSGGAGTRIPFRIVPPGSITGQPACTLTRNPRIAIGDAVVLDQNNEGRLGLPGWFTSAGLCAIGIELTLPGKSEPARVVAGPIPVQSPMRYTLSGTSTLRTRLGFRSSGSLGICDGTSIGPTNYSVGVLDGGADLALRIRSGPIGTECQFTSKPWVLPDGVRLLSTRWDGVPEIPSGQDHGKCCVVSAFGNNCITMPPHVGNNFTRGTVPIVTGEVGESPKYYSITSSDQQILQDGVIMFDNQSPRIVTVIKPMWGKLQCTNTGFNDHGVKLVLRELVLEGPSGLTFP